MSQYRRRTYCDIVACVSVTYHTTQGCVRCHHLTPSFLGPKANFFNFFFFAMHHNYFL